MEPSVTFHGRVLPTALNLTVRKHPTLKIRDIDADYDMLIDVSIEGGAVTVDCFVEGYRDEIHYMPLFTRSHDAASASVNLATFGMAVGAIVILESSLDSEGFGKLLIFRDRQLQNLCTSFKPDESSFDDVLEYVFDDLRLSHALRNLTEAISIPHSIPENCAKAIETIRNSLARGVDRKSAWPIMQEHLRISEAYLKSITNHGIGPRHGDPKYVASEKTRMIATRSWMIMNRFLEYKKRGSVPLPLEEFPLLTI